MRSTKHIIAAMLLLVLSGTSCKTTRQIQSREVESNNLQTDSVSLRMERIVKPLVVPKVAVQLKLHPDSLLKLPVGASFSRSEGHATATVTKEESGYSFTASCDSLTVVIEELKTEIYHLNKEKTAFKEQLNEQKIIEVNRLTSWQSFQVWMGRISLMLLVCFAGYKVIKNKFKI